MTRLLRHYNYTTFMMGGHISDTRARLRRVYELLTPTCESSFASHTHIHTHTHTHTLYTLFSREIMLPHRENLTQKHSIYLGENYTVKKQLIF